jgi:hypothetical protein
MEFLSWKKIDDALCLNIRGPGNREKWEKRMLNLLDLTEKHAQSKCPLF